MLDVFKKLITDKGYFFEDELKNIPSTCCTTSTFKVLDFDKIKEEFCNKYGINSYCKSNDILILYQPKDELHFIEMKRYPTKKAIDFCNTYKIANSTELREKNVHSIFLLLAMANHYGIDEKFYSTLMHNGNPNKIKIRTSVLCDLPDSEMIFVSISTLSLNGISLKSVIAQEIEVINCATFNKYFV